MVDNKDPGGSAYQENMEFPKFEGMELQEPEEGTSYSITVEAGA